MSANVFSNLTASLTSPLNELLIPSRIATDAPKAITRAFEASKDFVNSLAEELILPSGWVKLFWFTLKFIGFPLTLLTTLLISLVALSRLLLTP